MLPGGGAISDNPKIIASFTLHISINFFDLKRLIGSYLIIFKSLSGCYFSSLHCMALEIAERYLFFVWEKKCAFPQQAAAPPLAKRHPVFTLHGKDFALKLEPFPTICNTMLCFPNTQSSLQHCLLREFRFGIGQIPSICKAAKMFQEFQLEELIGQKVLQFRIKLYKLLEKKLNTVHM